jgi:hypothetical protein
MSKKDDINFYFVKFPIRSAGLGVIAGVLTYIFLGFIPGVTSTQRFVGLVGWPIITLVIALYWGAKEYRRLRKREIGQ